MLSTMATTCRSLVGIFLTTWLINLMLPTPSLVTAQSDNNSTIDKFIKYVQDHPQNVAMIGMGILILLLFATTIIVICTVGTRKNNKY